MSASSDGSGSRVIEGSVANTWSVVKVAAKKMVLVHMNILFSNFICGRGKRFI